MRRTLLLNAHWESVNFVTWERAIALVHKKRAELVDAWSGDNVCTASATYELPAVIRLLHHSNVILFRSSTRFRRRVVFNRDDWSCCYCGARLNKNTVTIDHIVPRSCGGKTTYPNCVTACARCNAKKSNRTLEQANVSLTLSIVQRLPRPIHHMNISLLDDEWHPRWDEYVGCKRKKE